jgi:predicted nucleotidyltransferase
MIAIYHRHHMDFVTTGEPMNTSERDLTIEMCRNNDVAIIGLFGSTARGEASVSSELDLLARFAIPKSLLSLVRLDL